MDIKSYNQKGGITAGTVNTLHKNINSVSKRKSIWSNPWLVTVIGGIIVFIIGGVILNAMSSEDDDKKQEVNVTSYDQSGGITANQVNIGTKQQRHLDESLKSQLSNMLKDFRGNKINLHYQNGDKEAFTLASEIKVYLDSESWEVSSPMSTQWFGEPHTGVMVVKPKDGTIRINVYAQQ